MTPLSAVPPPDEPERVVRSLAAVDDDAAVDTLYGGGDSDWFLANIVGGTLDILKDRKSPEIATDLG